MSLEREIEDLLAVDPSPEFVARVRERVAAGPRPSPWRVWWVLAPGSAVAAALIAAVISWPQSEPAVPPLPASTVHAPAPAERGRPIVAVPAAPSPIAAPRHLVPGLRSAPRQASRPAIARQLEPDIVLSANESRAFGVLLARLREGAMPAFEQSRIEEEQAARATIEPVVIAPIAQFAPAEGGHQ